VIIRLTIAPTSGSGAGVAVRGAEESLVAFEAVSEPHAQRAAHSGINSAILLSCIYLSEAPFVFTGAEIDIA
jgi:hypothetical protein